MADFTSAICLKPRFSKRLALILMILHSGALLWLWPLALPLIAKLGLGLLILTCAHVTTQRHLLFINHPLYGVVLRYDKLARCLKVELHSGVKAQIASGSYNHPQLVVLRVTNQRNALVIFPDALDAQTFRHLRVHLRHAHVQCQNRL